MTQVKGEITPVIRWYLCRGLDSVLIGSGGLIGDTTINPIDIKLKNKDKYKDDNEKATDVLRRTIMKKMGNNVKENFDNNNVVLRGINETLNKLEDKIDEKNGIEKEEVKLEKKQTFHDKFVKDLQDNTPHAGQFDEDI